VTATIQALTSVDAMLDLGEDSEPVRLASYRQGAHVVVGLVEPSEADELPELDPLLVLTPDCAEALGRDLLRRADEARSGHTRPMEEA
jgi:hypothetical protein